MARNITAGIDVGTHTTRVVVVGRDEKKTAPVILGLGLSESRGLRHGYISNPDEAVKSIRKAISRAEQSSGVKIKRAFLAVGGIGLSSEIVQGSTIISRASGEVMKLDIQNILRESEEKLELNNKKVIYFEPISYKLDGREVLGQPEGMRGAKLEAKIIFVTCLEQHLDNLLAAVEKAGAEIVDILPSPIAASAAILSEKQKTVGCILVNIGAETVSIAVFENGSLISLHVFSIGSTDITNDIALGFKIPILEAEQVKTGSLLGDYPKKKLDEIVEARLSDIFELIENHLKKIKRNGLLPAGAIIIGGGANAPAIENLSKTLLKLPSKVGSLGAQSKIKDSSWFVPYGLCLHKNREMWRTTRQTAGKLWPGFRNSIVSLVRQLLP